MVFRLSITWCDVVTGMYGLDSSSCCYGLMMHSWFSGEDEDGQQR